MQEDIHFSPQYLKVSMIFFKLKNICICHKIHWKLVDVYVVLTNRNAIIPKQASFCIAIIVQCYQQGHWFFPTESKTKIHFLTYKQCIKLSKRNKLNEIFKKWWVVEKMKVGVVKRYSKAASKKIRTQGGAYKS